MGVIERLRGPIWTLFDFIGGNATIIDVALAFFSTLVVLLVVFQIHECAHALMAKVLGDDTAEREGRLTLNPFAHIDPMGALAMCLCNIGWAKPTPVDIRRCDRVTLRTANALVSFAGPLSNILLSYILMIVYKALMQTAASDTVYYVALGVLEIIVINIYLAVFNLVPIPPFDGYHIIASFLPARALIWFERNQQTIRIIFFVVLMMGLIQIPLSYLAQGVIWLLDKATFYLGVLF